MIVGLTYDLRDEYLESGFSLEDVAEFDGRRTIEALEEALQKMGFATDRIGHVRRLAARLVRGDRWDMVFNIAEGLGGIGREAQVPALLEAYGIPCTFSDPLVMALTLHKGLAKSVVRDQGVATPDFVVVDAPDRISAIDLPYPLFAKPVAEGTGKGINPESKIDTPDQLDRVVRRLLDRYHQPVIVETYLPGREFTVGIVGRGDQARSLGVMEVVLLDNAEAHAYSFENKEKCEDRVRYELVQGDPGPACVRTALAAWRALECRDAGRVDLRLAADGTPHFLEVNPLAGLHPEHSDLPIICNLAGIPYQTLIEAIVTQTLERARTTPKVPDFDRPAAKTGAGTVPA